MRASFRVSASPRSHRVPLRDILGDAQDTAQVANSKVSHSHASFGGDGHSTRARRRSCRMHLTSEGIAARAQPLANRSRDKVPTCELSPTPISDTGGTP